MLKAGKQQTRKGKEMQTAALGEGLYLSMCRYLLAAANWRLAHFQKKQKHYKYLLAMRQKEKASTLKTASLPKAVVQTVSAQTTASFFFPP